MAAFVAKQMVGNKLSAVKGKVRYCVCRHRELCINFNEVQVCRGARPELIICHHVCSLWETRRCNSSSRTWTRLYFAISSCQPSTSVNKSVLSWKSWAAWHRTLSSSPMASFYFKLKTSKTCGWGKPRRRRVLTLSVPIRRVFKRVSWRVETLDISIGLWSLKPNPTSWTQNTSDFSWTCHQTEGTSWSWD